MKNAFKRFLVMPFLGVLMFALSSCAQPGTSVTNKKVEDGKTIVYPVTKTAQEWRNTLTAEQYEVLINKGTERPYSGKLLHNDKTGDYLCAACGNLLFKSDAKFDSHCGWPSFDKAIEGGKVITKADNSHGMERTEVLCAKCGGHLGHLFDDGPTPTGMRYCINSASLDFKEVHPKSPGVLPASDTVVLAGGCFWSIQAIYQKLKGVSNVSVGYAGGNKANPTYYEVSDGNTGYAESAQVVYDPNQVKLADILKVFFTIHNPTTLNRQGADIGTQYRSAIFFKNQQQKEAALEVIASLQKNNVYDNPIVTQVQPLKKFYKAEDYHQDYYNNNKKQGYCLAVVAPKIEKFEKAFKDLLK